VKAALAKNKAKKAAIEEKPAVKLAAKKPV